MESDGSNPSPETMAHRVLMRSLSERLDGLCGFIPKGSRVAFLDYPVYFNVGDLLIYLGTEKFLARNDCAIVARFSIFDLCMIHAERSPFATMKRWVKPYLDRLASDVILVFQGGGNFGDLYPYHQVLREEVCAMAGLRKIVILPQSIHFSNDTARRHSLRRLAEQPNLHLFVRDAPSFQGCSEFLSGHVHMMPDMAHALWGAFPTTPASDEALPLVQRRNDVEACLRTAPVPPGDSMDWSDLVTAPEHLTMRLIRKSMSLGLDPSHRYLCGAWNVVRSRVVERAVSLFLEHPALATDRLHGLILGSLLSRRVEYRDNSYGKLSRYAEAWLGAAPLILAPSDDSRLPRRSSLS